MALFASLQLHNTREFLATRGARVAPEDYALAKLCFNAIYFRSKPQPTATIVNSDKKLLNGDK
jgi:hypothetical protein